MRGTRGAFSPQRAEKRRGALEAPAELDDDQN